MAIHAKKSGMMISVMVIDETPADWYIQAMDEKHAKRLSKNGKQGRVFNSVAEAEAWISEQRPQVAVLTNAQIYTLRRMSNGREYRSQGDGKRAFERRPLPSSRLGFNDVNAPSIPALIRKGMVEIDPRYANPNPTSYYPVRLTVLGATTAKTAVIED